MPLLISKAFLVNYSIFLSGNKHCYFFEYYPHEMRYILLSILAKNGMFTMLATLRNPCSSEALKASLTAVRVKFYFLPMCRPVGTQADSRKPLQNPAAVTLSSPLRMLRPRIRGHFDRASRGRMCPIPRPFV
jgi:hypothetical protein